jgi:hypothetical protein
VGRVDYHLGELVQRRADTERVGPRFFARCKCGWFGPDRATVQSANEDAITHEQTRTNWLPIDTHRLP